MIQVPSYLGRRGAGEEKYLTNEIAVLSDCQNPSRSS